MKQKDTKITKEQAAVLRYLQALLWAEEMYERMRVTLNQKGPVALYAEFGQTAAQHLTLSQSLSLKTGVPFIVAQPKDLDGALSMVMGKA